MNYQDIHHTGVFPTEAASGVSHHLCFSAEGGCDSAEP